MVVMTEEKLKAKIEKEQRYINCSDQTLFHLLEGKYARNGRHKVNGQQWVLRRYINEKNLEIYYRPGGRREQVKKCDVKKEPLGGNTYVRGKKSGESWEQYQKYIHRYKEKILSAPGLSASDREYMESHHKKRGRYSGVFIPE